MVITRPKNYKSRTKYVRVEPIDGVQPVFVIHPSTSELAETLVIDPEALKGENYPGIYDSTGDYIPQFAESPDEIPQGALPSNPANSPGTAGGGAQTADNNTPPTPAESPAEPKTD